MTVSTQPARVPRAYRPAGLVPIIPLRRPTRRVLLISHIAVSVGWLGADVVMGILAVAGLTTDEPTLALSIFRAAGVFVPLVVLPLSLLALLTGVLLALGTKWGLLRYWWVLVKLAITVILSVLVLVLLRPSVADLADDAAAAQRDGSLLTVAASADPTALLVPATVSVVALTVAVILSVAKPSGRTRVR